MNRFEKQTFKSRLLKLARLKGTGTPSDLADRFEISERTIKRIVKELRDEGINIWYCPSVMSYVTEEKNAKHVV
jgi:predicted DNA-binding transcriptional regulator YafY